MFILIMKLKILKILQEYFEIEPEGNWEKKIILVEKEKPTQEILE